MPRLWTIIEREGRLEERGHRIGNRTRVLGLVALAPWRRAGLLGERLLERGPDEAVPVLEPRGEPVRRAGLEHAQPRFIVDRTDLETGQRRSGLLTHPRDEGRSEAPLERPLERREHGDRRLVRIRTTVPPGDAGAGRRHGPAARCIKHGQRKIAIGPQADEFRVELHVEHASFIERDRLGEQLVHAVGALGMGPVVPQHGALLDRHRSVVGRDDHARGRIEHHRALRGIDGPAPRITVDGGAPGPTRVMATTVGNPAGDDPTDVPIPVRDHRVLARAVPTGKQVHRLAGRAGVGHVEHLEVDRIGPGTDPQRDERPLDAIGASQLARDGAPPRHASHELDRLAPAHRDGLRLEREGLARAVGEHVPRWIRWIHVDDRDVLEIPGRVREADGDMRIAADHDAGHARDRETGPVDAWPLHAAPVPEDGRGDHEVRIVGEDRAAILGARARDDPAVAAGEGCALVPQSVQRVGPPVQGDGLARVVRLRALGLPAATLVLPGRSVLGRLHRWFKQRAVDAAQVDHVGTRNGRHRRRTGLRQDRAIQARERRTDEVEDRARQALERLGVDRIGASGARECMEHRQVDERAILGLPRLRRDAQQHVLHRWCRERTDAGVHALHVRLEDAPLARIEPFDACTSDLAATQIAAVDVGVDRTRSEQFRGLSCGEPAHHVHLREAIGRVGEAEGTRRIVLVGCDDRGHVEAIEGDLDRLREPGHGRGRCRGTVDGADEQREHDHGTGGDHAVQGSLKRCPSRCT